MYLIRIRATDLSATGRWRKLVINRSTELSLESGVRVASAAAKRPCPCQRHAAIISSLVPRHLQSEPKGQCRLLGFHIPEHRCRSLHHADQVLAHQRALVPLAERNVRDHLCSPYLHCLGDRLQFGWIGLARELIAQLLHLWIARPTE